MLTRWFFLAPWGQSPAPNNNTMTVGFSLRPRLTPINQPEQARDRALAQYIVSRRLIKLRLRERKIALDETVSNLLQEEREQA